MALVPGTISWRARALRNILEIVSGSNEAPVVFIEMADKVVTAWLDGGGQGSEPWMGVLVGIMKTHAPLENGRPMTSKNPTEAAKSVLASLFGSAPGTLPQQFTAPGPTKLEQAGQVLLGMRVKRSGGLCGEKPKAATNLLGTSMITPWTAPQ